jgi:hypothetical protein
LAEGKHVAKSPPRRSTPWIVAGSIVAVLAIATIAFFVFSGGGEAADGGDTEAPSTETPKFSFEIEDTHAVSTVEVETKDLRGPAKQAAHEAADALHRLYAVGYLDPANWREGSYDAVLSSFDGAARDVAETELDSLTAGPEAGTRFDDIQPGRSKVSVTVLFDDDDAPAAVEANATFSAKATGTDAGRTNILSQGRYFLELTGARWTIAAFEVDRREKEGRGGGTTASPSEEAS